MIVIDGVQIIINSVYEKKLREEIFNKIKFLLTLIKGTIPMNREIGHCGSSDVRSTEPVHG